MYCLERCTWDRNGVRAGTKEVEPDAGDLLANELSQLSTEERAHVLEEIHGVAKAVDETDTLVEKSLKEMEAEIGKVRKKSAYEKALFLNPDHVRDPAFRLMFLRAVGFDPRKAARRIINFFHHKMRLFGLDKLTRRITLTSLSADDLQDMCSGALQILPTKDRAGRTTIVSFHSKHQYKEFENHHRMTWYTIMSAMEDPVAQKLGLTTILYNVDFSGPSKRDIDFLLSSKWLKDTLPYRVASMHFCYNDSRLRPLISALQVISGKESRIRFRTHYGSHLECTYSLMGFGIPLNTLPLDNENNVSTEKVSSWMQARFEKERGLAIQKAAASTPGFLEFPLSTDVLLGRGRPFQEFPGNRRLAMLVEQHRNQYQSSDKLGKTAISLDIVRAIKSGGGRFLKRSEEAGGWTVVADGVAREKVSHNFRTKTRRILDGRDQCVKLEEESSS